MKNFVYSVSAKITTKASKLLEKRLEKIINKSFEWSYNYLNKHWFVSFKYFVGIYKLHYHIKEIKDNSYLYNELYCTYYGYKMYVDNCQNNYLQFLDNVKSVALDKRKSVM